MFNFIYHNPVKILFGKGMISELSHLIPPTSKVMILYGGGSIMKNGVYDQVKNALKDHKICEFGGIEPNPYYETLMKAVELGKKENVDFLLAVGGGSVADGTKFIAAAIEYKQGDPWDILARGASVEKALPIGCVLTLPATGSEMNGNSVVSKKATQEKLYFNTPLVYPKFSILDPETTFTLPVRQTVNGIVDSFVHVAEQYFTFDANTPLQDRQSEAILKTLVEESPKVLKKADDYEARANIMWCATQALNGLIGCGVAQDWATHMIGHELTALYGLDHAQTLAVVLPAVLKHQRNHKKQKLAQFAQRVWNILLGKEEEESILAIQKIEEFFASLGIAIRLKQYNIGAEKFEEIANRLEKRGLKLGEHQNICKQEVLQILQLCLE